MQHSSIWRVYRGELRAAAAIGATLCRWPEWLCWNKKLRESFHGQPVVFFREL